MRGIAHSRAAPNARINSTPLGLIGDGITGIGGLVRVGDAGMVFVTVGVFVGVPVGVAVGVIVGVLVGVPVGVVVGVVVGVPVGVSVGVIVGVSVDVPVGVFVGVSVGVGLGPIVNVSVGVEVGVVVGVLVGVLVTVFVGVKVGVSVGVGVGPSISSSPSVSPRGTVVGPLLDWMTVIVRGKTAALAPGRMSNTHSAMTPVPAGIAVPPSTSIITTLILPSVGHRTPPSWTSSSVRPAF